MSLTARIVVASLVLAAVVGAVFALLIRSVAGLRDSVAATQRSEEIIAAANRLERLLVDLETGVRGYIVTADPKFLGPYYRARREVPAVADEMQRPIRHVGLLEQARRIERDIQAYAEEWQGPLILVARTDPDRARRLVATREGKRRVDAIRAQFVNLVAAERRADRRRELLAAERVDRAVLIAAGGLVGGALLVGLFALYVARAVVAPVRRTARAARRLAGGRLGTRVPTRGAPEAAELGRAFNRMAGSLQSSIRERDVERARLLSVLNATADGICLVSLGGEILVENETAGRMTEEMLGASA